RKPPVTARVPLVDERDAPWGGLSLPPVARPGRRPGHQGQVFGRFLRLDRFGDVVVELNPDAVEPPPADTDVASVFDDDPLDRGQAPEQAHAVALPKGAGGSRRQRILEG